MERTGIKRLTQCLAHASVFLLLYFVSVVSNELALLSDPAGLYLLGWTTHNRYWYIWVISLALALCGFDVMAWTITVGNVIGVVVGQLLGDYLHQFRDLKELAFSGVHPGFRIWITCVVASFLIGVTMEVLVKLKHVRQHMRAERK